MGTDRHAFVVVANRLPVDRIDGAWEASPGGLVSAVAPVVREQAGAWVGWANTHDDSLEPFDFDGMSLVPVSAQPRRDISGTMRDSATPLMAAAPRPHRRAAVPPLMVAGLSGSQRAIRTGRGRGRRDRGDDLGT